MSNENCLRGLRCPACQNEGPFRIVVKCVAVVYDDGIDETTEHEWDDEDSCSCVDCGHLGKVRDFRRPEPEAETYECQGCGWRGPELGREWPDIPDLCSRVAPGETVPAGECPLCGALAHVIKNEGPA